MDIKNPWINRCITCGNHMEQAVETPCIRLCIRKGRELYSLSTVYTPFSTAFPYWRPYLSTILLISIKPCFSYLYFSFVSPYPHYPHPIISITFFIVYKITKEKKNDIIMMFFDGDGEGGGKSDGGYLYFFQNFFVVLLSQLYML